MTSTQSVGVNPNVVSTSQTATSNVNSATGTQSSAPPNINRATGTQGSMLSPNIESGRLPVK